MSQPSRAMALLVVTALLTGCAVARQDEVQVHAPEPISITTKSPMISGHGMELVAADAAIRKGIHDVIVWERAVNFAELVRALEVPTVPTPAPTRSVATPPAPTAEPSSASLSSVIQCIKDHESGDYAESSHLDSGSGAYQFIPSTWQTWSERAGYGGYAYAYLAPPEVQDAVITYALTNGGAGNWSPRYGNDPCTVGMGG